MDANLAKFLFGNEVLYKDNVLSQPVAVKQAKVEQKAEAIVEVVSMPQAEVIKPQANVSVKSSNGDVYEPKNKVLILTQTIIEEEKALLGKIIGAVGLSFENVDLIELSKVQVPDYQLLISSKKTTKLISFGIGFSKLGWSVMVVPYQNKTTDGIEFLLADNLKNISTNQALKKSLWTSLQKMFVMAS